MCPKCVTGVLQGCYKDDTGGVKYVLHGCDKDLTDVLMDCSGCVIYVYQG